MARPHWDAPSPELAANLHAVSRRLTAHAISRAPLTLDEIRHWHGRMLQGLAIPEAGRLGVSEDDLRGHFRGPPRLAHVRVAIGLHHGAEPAEVAAECERFIRTLDSLVAALDGQIPIGTTAAASPAAFADVTEAAGWCHATWVRIHPFGNGNGRTARLLCNWLLLRYGLPPVLTPRPRPGVPYAQACEEAMAGRHQATVRLLRGLLEALKGM